MNRVIKEIIDNEEPILKVYGVAIHKMNNIYAVFLVESYEYIGAGANLSEAARIAFDWLLGRDTS